MKSYLLLFSLLLSSTLFAQEKRVACSNSEHNKQFENNPEYSAIRTSLGKFTKEYIQKAKVERTSSNQLYVIPVVFHVLHQYGPENISDSQIIDAVNIMNRDFQKLNADTIDIVASFQSIAADCEIEFRLAKIDPLGNCTDGIERINTPLTNNADNNSKIHQWPNNKYLNIWIVNSLFGGSSYGFTSQPGYPDSLDGLMMIHQYIGRIGTGSPGSARHIIHELGHYFNLYNTWGLTGAPGFVCGDDSIADTPETMGWDHCVLNGSVCNPPIIENVQNYMDESFCTLMFTQEQKTRMHALLNSPVNGRNNLWTMQNLIATGTDGSPITICSPHADFNSSPYNACVGSNITFMDQSWNAPITNWSWSFPGGNPASSNGSMPVVIYSAAGLYDVSLTVTSAGGTDSITKTSTVRISDTAMMSMPFTEDFENATSFPGVDGWIENHDSSMINLWTRVSNANTTSGGSNSIMIDNFTNSITEIDSWISPSIDFSNVSSPIVLTFQVANAQRDSNSQDELRLFLSVNCGATWIPTNYAKSGSTLSTAGVLTSVFTPANISDWRLETIPCNPVQNQPSVRFKFVNTSDHGNNTFIDDINIIGNVNAIDKKTELGNGFAIYPNPSNGSSTISFGINKLSQVTIDVNNILGQTVFHVLDETLSPGLHENKLPVLSPGIYLVEMTVNEKQLIRKFVVN